MDKSTPTPWVYRKSPGEPGGLILSTAPQTLGGDCTVAIVREAEPADTALIVRAVNSHDMLVEALRKMLELIDASSIGKPGNIISRERIAVARAALALAKE